MRVGLLFLCFVTSLSARAALPRDLCSVDLLTARLSEMPIDPALGVPKDFRLELTEVETLWNVRRQLIALLPTNNHPRYRTTLTNIDSLFIAGFHGLARSPRFREYRERAQMSDLEVLSIATIAVLDALEHWQPTGGATFGTFLFFYLRKHYIRAEIEAMGIRHHAYGHLGDVSRAEATLMTRLGRPGRPDEIAVEAGLTVDKLEEVYELRLSVNAQRAGQAATGNPARLVPDTRTPSAIDTAAQRALVEQINQVLATLTVREREVVAYRYPAGEDVAAVFASTRERIRRIEARALSENPPR